MALFGIRVDEGPKVRLLRKVTEEAPELMAQWGSYLVDKARQSFRDQKSPLGAAWPARHAPSYANVVAGLSRGILKLSWLTETRPALVQSGTLRDSVTYRVIGPKSVEVTSGLPYARLQHDGGTNTLPVTETVKSNLAAILKVSPILGHGFLRPTLGFLFRKTELTVDVPARPWTGVSDEMRADLASMTHDYLDANTEAERTQRSRERRRGNR